MTNDLLELFNRIEYLRKNGVKMKEIANCAGMAPSILSSLYTTVLPAYFEEIKTKPQEDALESALTLVNNLSKRRLLNSLPSSSDCLKMEPFIITAPEHQGYIKIGRLNAYGEAQWGIGIIGDPQNFYCMFSENPAPQFTLVTIYLQIPFFHNPKQLRGLYIGLDYNRNPVSRRILLIKSSDNTDMNIFTSMPAGLIQKEDFTPEQQAYYDYTCQTGDYIKMCTVLSLQMNETDLIKEKKMLEL